jgi:predicted nucleic acid-binding protein
VIALDRLGYIEVLRQVADVILAPAVVQELRAGVDKPGNRVPDLDWIQIRVPAEGDMDEVLRAMDAHAGEQETVALAMGGTIEPVIDEGPARRYAAERGLPITGTLALLVGLHQRGLATRAVEEDLALLTAGGMYLTEDLKSWTIERVRLGERSGAERGVIPD